MRYLDGAERGVFSRAELRELGVSASSFRASLDRREYISVGRLHVVDGQVPDAVKAAVRSGGSLTCLSALREHGVWTYPDRSIHLLRPRKARSTYPLPENGCDCRGRFGGAEGRLVVPLATALSAALTCHPAVHGVVAVDDIRRRRLLPEHELEHVLAECSARKRSAVAVADGTVESALESVVRHLLWSAGIGFRVQVVLDGIGRVDFLIGEKLILEVDGFEFHGHVDGFRNDRRRDLSAAAQGYVTIRVTWWDVLHKWPTILGDLQSIVRRRGHRAR